MGRPLHRPSGGLPHGRPLSRGTGTFPDVGRSSYAVRAASRANLCGDPESHTEPSLRERLRRPWTPPTPRPSRPLSRKGPGWSVAAAEQIRSTPARIGSYAAICTSTNVGVKLYATAPDDSSCNAVSPLTRKRSPPLTQRFPFVRRRQHSS